MNQQNQLIQAEAEQTLVPYDENLLERARTQWQFGDWNSLAQLDRDTLQHHPDRAKLALLAAAGHLQIHSSDEAKPFLRFAQDWGVSKKLMAQILAAGVHNSLGRAAALARKPTKSLQHFESAIAVGTPGTATQLLLQARAGSQLQQLGLPGGNAQLNISASSTVGLTPIATHFHTITDILNQQKLHLDTQLKNQADELLNLRKHLEKKLKQEMLNATQQLEAFLDIQSFFNNGEHLPLMHGWPVSPDFALYLIQLLEKNHYDLILEFGSGTSTVIMAKTLEHLKSAGASKSATLQIAFEHLKKYHDQTLAGLEASKLAKAVQLVLAPLQPYQSPEGNTYSYYDCHDTLADLAKTFPVSGIKILMIVDGPPSSTGKHARYPALPAVLAHFKNHAVDILLDDYVRADEKEVGALWEKDFKQLGHFVEIENINMEKGALLISSRP